MTRLILSTVLVLGFIASAHSQSGASLRLGTGTYATENTTFTTPEEINNMWHFGISARLGAYTWYFNPSVYYYNVGVTSSDTFAPFQETQRKHLLKVPINFGLRLYRSHLLTVRAYGGVVGNYVAQIDDGDYDYDEIKDVYVGADLGAGIDIKWITMDVIYEQGLTNAYQGDGDSKANVWSFQLGFFF